MARSGRRRRGSPRRLRAGARGPVRRRQRPQLPPAVRERRTARLRQPGAARRAADRHGRRRHPHRQRPGRGDDLGRRAAASREHGDHPRHLAVGDREPLRLDRAGPRQRRGARGRSDAVGREDHLARRPRPALQHLAAADAQGASERDPGLRLALRQPHRGRAEDLQVLRARPVDGPAPVRRAEQRQPGAQPVPGPGLAGARGDRGASRRPLGADRRTPTSSWARSRASKAPSTPRSRPSRRRFARRTPPSSTCARSSTT